MKKSYSAPFAEKIAFDYRDQVVAASAGEGGGAGVEDTTTEDTPQNSTPTWEDVIGGAVDFLWSVVGFC